jgi:hypothetical protein
VLWSLFTEPVKLKKEPAWSALNLFFDGNGSTPGISVFGALDNSSFEPDNGNTLMLTGSSPNTPPAATLGLSEASGAPYAKLMATGTSFAANETVEIFAGPIGASPVFATATADASGSFSVAGRAPQHPLGPMDVYAVGEQSQVGSDDFVSHTCIGGGSRYVNARRKRYRQCSRIRSRRAGQCLLE